MLQNNIFLINPLFSIILAIISTLKISSKKIAAYGSLLILFFNIYLSSNHSIIYNDISLLLCILTSFLIFLCIINAPKNNTKRYLSMFLLLESFLLLAFSASNLLVFYITFEATLIPLFIIINTWGGKNRMYASFTMLLYTISCSLCMLVALSYIYVNCQTMDIEMLKIKINIIPAKTQQLLWWCFFIAFAVKMPIIPLHIWLPNAHTQAPAAGSVILAGVLLKLGAYGFIKILLPIFPKISLHYTPIINYLSVFAVIYASLAAIAQTNIKKTIAYSSIAHMGFVSIGIFSFNKYGMYGAIMQIISHGLVSSGLFFIIGYIYQRTNTQEIQNLGGLLNNMPICATFFIMLACSAIGFPGTSSFISELLVLLGIGQNSKVLTCGIASGIIMSTLYMLPLYQNIFTGKTSSFPNSPDLKTVEIITIISLLIFILLIGLFPQVILRFTENNISQIQLS